jgi:acetyltransferase-like isoleucine patch superfamily enzyme
MIKKILKKVIYSLKFRTRKLFGFHLKSRIFGLKNNITYSNSVSFQNVIIDVNGNGNEIIIDENCRLTNMLIYIRGNCAKIRIGSNVSFNRGSEIWVEDDNCVLDIGSFSTFEKVHLAITENNSKLIIGKDCMFATDIDVRTGDSHSIIDKISGKRLNFASSVIIGNHVWVGAAVSILKGVTICDNCIIGTRSVVTKSLGVPHSTYAGIPAKSVKQNVNWNRERLSE